MNWHKTTSEERPRNRQRCICIRFDERERKYYIAILRYLVVKDTQYWEDVEDCYPFTSTNAWMNLEEIEKDYKITASTDM